MLIIMIKAAQNDNTRRQTIQDRGYLSLWFVFMAVSVMPIKNIASLNIDPCGSGKGWKWRVLELLIRSFCVLFMAFRYTLTYSTILETKASVIKALRKLHGKPILRL